MPTNDEAALKRSFLAVRKPIAQFAASWTTVSGSGLTQAVSKDSLIICTDFERAPATPLRRLPHAVTRSPA
jgi:hypothetical protein